MKIWFPGRWIQRWPHRALRTLAFRFSLRAFLEATVTVVAAGSALLFAVLEESNSSLRHVGWVLFWAVAGLSFLHMLVALFDKRGAEMVRRKSIWASLCLVHEHAFHSSPDFRLTLFFVDPVAKYRVRAENGHKHAEEILVPLFRKSSGEDEYSSPASQAFYPLSSKAVTSVAWKRATEARDRLRSRDFELFTYSFPDFQGRGAMEDYYRDELGIDAEIVKRLSDHMETVVQIFSFPLTDPSGRLLALLSVDSEARFRFENADGGEGNKNRAEEVRVIDVHVLARSLEGMRVNLEQVGYQRRS